MLDNDFMYVLSVEDEENSITIAGFEEYDDAVKVTDFMFSYLVYPKGYILFLRNTCTEETLYKIHF